MYRHARASITVLLVVAIALSASAPVAADAAADLPRAPASAPLWEWPIDGPRHVVAPYRAPAHAYGAGHRGVDLATSIGAIVRAPADGTVAFRGTVVDRPLLTIEHSDGYVSTFEPLQSTLSPGDVVVAGDEIGTIAVGGHSRTGTLHLGVRLEGAYINPMLLFGAVPRAVLLPCCDR